MYISNPRSTDLENLPFYDDKRLMAGQRVYHINDDIVFRFNNVLIVDVYTITM